MDAFRLNKSDYKIIAGYLLVATLWLVINFYVENYTRVEYFIDIPVFWLHTIALLFVSKQLIGNFIVKKRNFFMLIILGIFCLWFFGFLASLSGEISRSGTLDWSLFSSFSELISNNINSSAANLGIPLVLISSKKYYEYQLQSITFSNTQKELELKLLRSQFNPHFLYNSLNTIDALVDYSPKEKVKEYISNLASLYRYLIKTNEEDIVSLEDELLLAKNYIYLIETRFENDYQFHIKNEEGVRDRFLPSGSLLTALENIVKHNQSQLNTQIITSILIKNEQIIITNNISENGGVNESFGTGLKNLMKRYKLLSDLVIEINETEKDFTLTLPLLRLIS